MRNRRFLIHHDRVVFGIIAKGSPMKKLLLSGIFVILMTHHALAVPITSGTLADLINLGSGGGTIGSTLFSDFAILPLQTGATQLSPTSISVSPIGAPNNPGLQFGFNQTANANQLFEMRVSYRVSGSLISGASVGLLGSSVTGDGANTALLQLMQPGQSLIAFDIGLLSETPVFGQFTPLTQLTVESDVVIDGGTAGRAILASATNQFNVSASPAIPEPTSAVIAMTLFGVFFTQSRCRRLRVA